MRILSEETSRFIRTLRHISSQNRWTQHGLDSFLRPPLRDYYKDYHPLKRISVLTKEIELPKTNCTNLPKPTLAKTTDALHSGDRLRSPGSSDSARIKNWGGMDTVRRIRLSKASEWS